MSKRAGKTLVVSSVLAGLAILITLVALYEAYGCGVDCSVDGTMHIQGLAETAKTLGIAAIATAVIGVGTARARNKNRN